jgi:hypothetical protein
MHAIWKLEYPEQTQSAQPPDLTLHVRHATLTCICMRVGERAQSYVAGEACVGCVTARCLPGCRAQLLRRTLASAGIRMSAVPLRRGLAQRPYCRAALALPSRGARLPDAQALASWQEARLCVSWRMRGGRLWVGLLLRVGDDGPPPALELRHHGWLALPASPRLQWLAAPLGPLPRSAPGAGPRLFGPVEVAVCAPAMLAVPQQPVSADDDRYAEALRSLEALDRRSLSEQAGAAAGQAPAIESQRLRHILHTLVTSAEFTEGRPGRVGLAASRLSRVLGLRQHEARMLLAWLDSAGLVAPPADPARPWIMPRPLLACDIDLIAARLQSQPPPDEAQVRVLFGGQ